MIIFPDGPGLESSQKIDESVKPFPNLRAAGRELALRLTKYREADNVVVLALVSGGTPVAHEVARFLRRPLDLLIIRRLLAPPRPESSLLCAVSIAGSMVVPEELMPRPATPSTPLDHFLADAIAELNHRAHISRRGLPPLNLEGQTVVLVDCGIRTGSTMRAAITALRTKVPEKIIAAVPVTSQGGQKAITALCDEFIYLARPERFGHVGLWYSDFSRPDDDCVGELLAPGHDVISADREE
jgi:putative phosphoribosyl transferase